MDVNDSGSIFEFKVHDLIHDLALYVAGEDILVVDWDTRSIPKQVRHLSAVQNFSLDPKLFTKSKKVRTILFPNFVVGLGSNRLLDTWMSRYKYLRYLNLSNSLLKTIPNSISKLEHLRFLDLSFNDQIRTLPNSICKLLHLQVLLLSGCTMLENLPKGLGKLISLRRLSVTTKQSVLPLDEFVSLIHLQTLSFQNCDNMRFLFRQKLPSIEELHFRSCGCLESLPLHLFPKLQTLYIDSCENLNLLLNNKCPTPPLRLKHLYLIGFSMLVTLPGWIACAMDTLETMVVSNLPNLKMLPVFLTTMTRLKRLYILDCPQLLNLPRDIYGLTALEDLRLSGCSKLC
jgi:Leucine-rich repeat (LRR) protein